MCHPNPFASWMVFELFDPRQLVHLPLQILHCNDKEVGDIGSPCLIPLSLEWFSKTTIEDQGIGDCGYIFHNPTDELLREPKVY